jgi:hypothetical protein
VTVKEGFYAASGLKVFSRHYKKYQSRLKVFSEHYKKYQPQEMIVGGGQLSQIIV